MLRQCDGLDCHRLENQGGQQPFRLRVLPQSARRKTSTQSLFCCAPKFRNGALSMKSWLAWSLWVADSKGPWYLLPLAIWPQHALHLSCFT